MQVTLAGVLSVTLILTIPPIQRIYRISSPGKRSLNQWLRDPCDPEHYGPALIPATAPLGRGPRKGVLMSGNPRLYELIEHAPKTGSSPTIWAWPQIVDYFKVAAQPVQGPWPPNQEPRPDPTADSLPV